MTDDSEMLAWLGRLEGRIDRMAEDAGEIGQCLTRVENQVATLEARLASRRNGLANGFDRIPRRLDIAENLA